MERKARGEPDSSIVGFKPNETKNAEEVKRANPSDDAVIIFTQEEAKTFLVELGRLENTYMGTVLTKLKIIAKRKDDNVILIEPSETKEKKS